MKYFAEGLPKKQINLLKALGPQMAPKGFYLAGGTALAIHYGHRISVDLDWFTPQPFDDSLLLAQALRNSGLTLEIEHISPGTLHGSIKDVRVTFLQYQSRCLSQYSTGKTWTAILPLSRISPV